jgi:hypothetical protein
MADLGGHSGNVAEDVATVAKSITLEEIDELISQASSHAAALQGSCSEPSRNDSQMVHDNLIDQDQRSRGSKESRSQIRINLAKAEVEKFFGTEGLECTLADLGGLLLDILMSLDEHCGCKPDMASYFRWFGAHSALFSVNPCSLNFGSNGLLHGLLGVCWEA